MTATVQIWLFFLYEAVVGIAGQAHANGDGRAITLHQANLDLPDLKLAARVD